MPRFEAHIVRHGDAATPHFSVRFIAGDGESVTADFHLAAAQDVEPSRETVLDAAWDIVSRLAQQAPERQERRTPVQTTASRSAGLSRAVGETEADTHGSEGRDTGTA
ncbi:hypothetical protein [Aquibium sp. ELW1220]|uniref:hypothetical protein n=1 Tax=Aquibium sp. ELW1220 TaxID=2976766 RepID=UPI0025AFA0CA|nr:hypothetical protein [Aquibium sp. ELW1220]MDN2578489.1 hypothetical protein [Aquibium sp. ELW1220]